MSNKLIVDFTVFSADPSVTVFNPKTKERTALYIKDFARDLSDIISEFEIKEVDYVIFKGDEGKKSLVKQLDFSSQIRYNIVEG